MSEEKWTGTNMLLAVKKWKCPKGHRNPNYDCFDREHICPYLEGPHYEEDYGGYQTKYYVCRAQGKEFAVRGGLTRWMNIIPWVLADHPIYLTPARNEKIAMDEALKRYKNYSEECMAYYDKHPKAMEAYIQNHSELFYDLSDEDSEETPAPETFPPKEWWDSYDEVVTTQKREETTHG